MTIATRRRPVVALAVALFVAVPVVGTGGAALAAPATGGSVPSAQGVRPAAAPSSSPLVTLADLLARLLPSPTGAVPGLTPTLASQVTSSTVRVNGVACGVRVAGSGFTVAPDTVLTNAHVVAGTGTTSVLRPDGKVLPAQVQAFDPKRDLAVLSVPGLGEPALDVASATAGETDAVFGHPLGQAPIEISPARVARRVTADIGDIYDHSGALRQILVLNSDLAPGDSGAPLVNSSGKVVGVAFAIATTRRSTAFAVASEEIAPVLAQPRTGPVSTGPCIDEG